MPDSELSHRLRSLIFESVARTDLFGDLIAQTDAAMRTHPDIGLRDLVAEFEDASDIVLRTGAAGQAATEVRFSFDRNGRVITGTASAISVFGLTPGDNLFNRLGDSGHLALEDLIRGKRSQASFTLLTEPRLRPVPVFAQSNENGSYDAVAISVGWNSAVVPVLKAGYQLTDAEIDIVEHLFRGHQLAEIATHRGRALETVRTQVRTICRKTDTRGQVDIVHLVYGLMATTQFLSTEETARAHGNYLLDLPNGHRMDVEVTGSNQGRPLLFLHGCLAGRRLQEAAVRRLSEHRIIAPGRPGHGQTPSDQPSDPKAVAADLCHVLDYFNIAQANVVAYDLGTPFALWLATLAPERVRSLLCLAPVPPLRGWRNLWSLPPETRVFAMLSRTNPSAARYLALLGGQRILRQGPSGFGKIVFANSRQDQELVSASETIQKLFWHGHAWHVERGPDGFLADAQLSSTAWDEGLMRLSQSPVFVLGEVDRNTPQAGVQKLADRVGARTATIATAGHSLLHANAAAWVVQFEEILS